MIITYEYFLCIVARTNAVGEFEVFGHVKSLDQPTFHGENKNAHHFRLQDNNT